MGINVTAINGMGTAEISGSVVVTTGMGAEDHMHISEDFLNQGGVVGASDMNVTERGAGANRSVDVASGTAYVLNANWSATSLTEPRFWRVKNSATVNVSNSVNASGNPRIDLLCLKIDTGASPDEDASNVATFVIVEGTPAGSPVAPAIPSNHLVLAQIAIANGYSSITNSNITNRRLTANITNALIDWIPVSETWTRTGNFTFTIFGDFTSKYFRGVKIRYKDGGSDEYLEVYTATYSAGTGLTTVTLVSRSDVTMASATITDRYISYHELPYGYPEWKRTTAFSASMSTNTSTANNDVINFNTEYYDIGSNYDTTNKIYTARISGLYEFTIQIAVESPTDQQRYGINTRYNGSAATSQHQVLSTRLQASGTGAMYINAKYDVWLSAGDTIDVIALFEATKTINATNGFTKFQGHLVVVGNAP